MESAFLFPPAPPLFRFERILLNLRSIVKRGDYRKDWLAETTRNNFVRFCFSVLGSKHRTKQFSRIQFKRSRRCWRKGGGPPPHHGTVSRAD
ncbi:hypothetical protein TNCV_2203701 [Trichonephila clavipes]|nr:hypothetical protein TNCV_2203701 [Trichonephila clavipes]